MGDGSIGQTFLLFFETIENALRAQGAEIMDEQGVLVYEVLGEFRNLSFRNGAIDSAIKKYFVGQRVCIRVLSSEVHHGKTIEQLIDVIKYTGTDRYDPSIKSGRYDNKEERRIDFFALDFFISPETKILDEFTWRRKLRPPLKIDVIIIYDIAQVERVLYTPLGRSDAKRDGFVFKNTLKKKDALKAIFKVVAAA